MTDNISNINDKQVLLEREMREHGLSRYHKNNFKKAERQQESTTDYGQHLLRATLESLETAIADYVESSLNGKAGKAATGAVLVSSLEPSVLAIITLKVVLNQITRQRAFTSTAVSLGMAIEDELRIRSFEENNPRLMKVVMQDLESRSSSYSYKRRKLIESARRDGVEWQSWTQRERLLVGNAMIDLTIQNTGLITHKMVTSGGKKRRLVLPTDTTMEAIKDLNAFKEILKPDFYPCVVPPRDWTSPYDGGYHSHHIRPLTMVKTDNHNYLSELKHFEMPQVYGAVNAMQRTPFKVNKGILDVLREIWNTGIDLPTLPPSENYPIPAKPQDIATNKEARTAWKREAVIIHTENNRLDSKRLLLRKTIEVADKFQNEPELYMVYQLDFRGRAYCVPNYLNPQGTDFAKSLLVFAHGKEIDEGGACHLAIHGANCFGFDKVSLQDRIDWVQKNQEQILSCASDPLSNLWWAKEADSPFQFLAFCFEWAGWCEQGEGFVSHLPVSADGSCNGLQHFAAMLRSSTTGKEVNLIPNDEPQDIYQKVADRVTDKLGTMDDPLAKLWLEFGVKRGCTKRPCMVLPYGGKQYSFSDFVMDYIVEQKEKGNMHPFGDDAFKASTFLAKVIWDSIGEIVHAATDAMAWLQKASRVASSEGLPIRWDTPCNFPVLQAYPETRPFRIETKLLGSAFRPALYKETGKLDKNRQSNGISPNFVHSIDAAHMMITIDVAKQCEIYSFAMVHDSYGTHAADAELMWWCLRKAFVEMYCQVDVLEDFRIDLLDVLPAHRHAEIDPIPQKGDLDIRVVEDSPFFFA
jgi:DNA-directed RNA polymerase